METELDLLLVDARHLLWRAASVFFDLHIKDAKSGAIRPTGGIYGWLRIAMSTHRQFGGMVFACWDRIEGPIHRRVLYPEYKNRPKSPPKPMRRKEQAEYDAHDQGRAPVEREVMLAQMAEQETELQRLLQLLGVHQASSIGWEADDVIATMCRKFDGQNIGILSGDRDLIQLVRPGVTLIRPVPKTKTQPDAQFEVLTPDAVRASFGFEPQRILDYKALSGDVSDNIPGAKGIGDVTAKKLIQEHQSWIQAIQWATTAAPASKLAQKLLASRDMVKLSAQLAALNDRVRLEFIDPQRDIRRAFMEMLRLKFQSLLIDGRKELLLDLA